MSGGDFVPFTGKGGHVDQRGSREYPSVTISQGELSLGKAVHEEFLDDAPRVEYLIDREGGRVGLRPVDDDEPLPHAYAVSDHTLRTINLWKTMGVALDESQQIPVDVESADFPVLDVSAFVVDGDGCGGEKEKHSGSSPPTVTDEQRADVDTHSTDQMGAPEYQLEDDERIDAPAADDTGENHRESEDGAKVDARDGTEDTEKKDDDTPSDSDGDADGLEALLDVDGIGPSKIETLRDDGFETLEAVRDASVSDVAQQGVISTYYASEIADHATDVLGDDPGDGSQSDSDGDGSGTADAAEVIDASDDDKSNGQSSGEKTAGSTDGTVERLDPAEIETVLAELDVPIEVTVSDVVQAVDGNSGCHYVGRDLGISRPDAEVLIDKLDLKPALESDEGLTAKRLQLAENGGEAV